jgi:hypothetical protein
VANVEMSPPADSPPIDLDALSNAEQLEQIAELTRVVAALREEIARAQRRAAAAHHKPSGMERATDPKPPDAGSKPRAPHASSSRSMRSALSGSCRRQARASKAMRAMRCRTS